MTRQERNGDMKAVLVERRGKIPERLRSVAAAVKQEHCPSARTLEHKTFGADHNAGWPEVPALSVRFDDASQVERAPPQARDQEGGQSRNQHDRAAQSGESCIGNAAHRAGARDNWIKFALGKEHTI
jgi:hypothetical protein